MGRITTVVAIFLVSFNSLSYALSTDTHEVIKDF
jgi:hypothetical protein